MAPSRELKTTTDGNEGSLEFLILAGTGKRIVVWIFFSFLFVLVPLWFLYSGVVKVAEDRSIQGDSEAFSRAAQYLDQLQFYKNQENFFSRLFQLAYQRAEKSSDPIKSLKNSRRAIQRVYGPHFSWIVWGENGALVKELTDFQKFAFIIKKTREGLLDLNKWFPGGEKSEKRALAVLELKRFKQIKAFIGPFLVAHHLLNSLEEPENAGLAFSRFSAEKTFFWQKVGNRFGMAVFINRAAVEENAGLQGLIKIHNRIKRNDRAFLGLFDPFQKHAVTPFPAGIASASFFARLNRLWQEKTSRGKSNDSYLVGKPLDNYHLGYCLYSAPRRNFTRHAELAPLCLGILLGGFLLVISFQIIIQRKEVYLSIRLQLALVFLYATGFPLIVYLFMSFQEVVHLERTLRSDLQTFGRNLLESFDQNFTSKLPELEDKFALMCANFEREIAAHSLESSFLQKLVNKSGSMQPDTATIVATDSREFRLEVQGKQLRSGTFREFGIQALGRMRDLNEHRFAQKGTILNERAQLASREIMRVGSIQKWNLGITAISLIWSDLKGASGKPVLYFQLGWREGFLEEQYVREKLLSLQRNKNGLQVFAFNRKTSRFFPVERSELSTKIAQLFDRPSLKQGKMVQRITWRGRKCLAVGFVGKEMPMFSFIGLLPLTEVETQIREIRTRANIFLALISVLTVFLGYVLSRNFLFPAHQLHNAAAAVSGRDFRFRVDGLANDEFGLVGSFFNSAMIGLEEFQDAGMIQESLFPRNLMRVSQWKLFSYQDTGKQLNKDFFDVFPISSNETGLGLGTIRDTGVSAALVLGLVKSVLGSIASRKTDPVEVLTDFHSLFSGFRGSKTFQSLGLTYALISDRGEISALDGGGGSVCVFKKATGKFLRVVSGGPNISASQWRPGDPFCAKLDRGDLILLLSRGLITSAPAMVRVEQEILSETKNLLSPDFTVLGKTLAAAIISATSPSKEEPGSLVMVAEFAPERPL